MKTGNDTRSYPGSRQHEKGQSVYRGNLGFSDERVQKVEALLVEDVYSSYFADESRFPKGTASFDCALIMRNISHEWHAANDLRIQRKESNP